MKTAAIFVLSASTAFAYQIESPITDNCHERMAWQALTQVGYVSTPPAPAGDDAQLAGALEFDTSGYDKNIYAWSLLVGVRHPDLLGTSLSSPHAVAAVHNSAEGQGEHCLRSAQHDGAAGDAEALADCRRVIERLYWEAADLDPGARVSMPVHMPYRGRAQYPFSAFYAAAGRALHAIQDSFTHTYRTADFRRIVHVFNWVDQVMCDRDEARDGHNHESAMDHCAGDDPWSAARGDAAVEASAQFLDALTRPGRREERQARLDAFFADWFEHVPGCDASNEYCGHPVHGWLVEGGHSDAGACEGATGCATGGDSPSAALVIAILLGYALRLRKSRG